MERSFGSLSHAGLEALDLTQHGRGMKQEIAAVPEITIGYVLRGGHGIRLLHERFNRENRRAIEFFARSDVTVIRRRVGGLDPEGDDSALRRACCRSAA